MLEALAKPTGFRKNLDGPLPKKKAVGSLHLDWTTCGKPTCRCAKGILHGPYVYHRWRDGGRQRKTYVPVRELQRLMTEMERRRALMPRPSQVKRELKELRHAL